MQYKCNLKAIREKRGMSRGTLARKSGVSPQAICYIEAGVRGPEELKSLKVEVSTEALEKFKEELK